MLHHNEALHACLYIHMFRKEVVISFLIYNGLILVIDFKFVSLYNLDASVHEFNVRKLKVTI